MPRGNRRGPEGMGPMTGRGLGTCAGNSAPGFENDNAMPRRGRGINRGFGRRGCGFGNGNGRGAGRGFGLSQEVADLKAQLAAIQAKINEL